MITLHFAFDDPVLPCSSVPVPHTPIASVTAFFSACITYRVTYQVSNVRDRTEEKAAFSRISTTVLIPSCPLPARFYAQPTLPLDLAVKKKIKSVTQATPPAPSAFTSFSSPFANIYYRLPSPHAASEPRAPAYRLQPCRRGIQRLAAVTERRGKTRVIRLFRNAGRLVSYVLLRALNAERLRCCAEERGARGVPR